MTPCWILVSLMLELHNPLWHDASSFCDVSSSYTGLMRVCFQHMQSVSQFMPNKTLALSFCPCSFFIQATEGVHEGENEENGLSSDDYTPSPSDEEYEHTLDCSAKSHKPSEQEQNVLESKEESQQSNTLKPPTDLPLTTELAAPTEEETVEHPPTGSYPVPKPRLSRQASPSPEPSPPVARPRTVHLFTPSTPEKQSSPTPANEIPKPAPDSHPKQSLRKLQLTDEEKSQLMNLHSLSADSDSETPGGSSSCSSSSATARGPSPPKPEGLDGQEEEGYWSGSTASNYREKRHRRGIRKKELPSGQTRVRSKFSPWNLSSPRISRDTRLSVLINHPERVGKLKSLLCFDLLRKKNSCRRSLPFSKMFLIYSGCLWHVLCWNFQKRHSVTFTAPPKRVSMETRMMTTRMMTMMRCLNEMTLTYMMRK